MNFSGISREGVVGTLLRLPLKMVPRGLRVPILQGPLRGQKWVTGSATHGCWLGSYEYEKQHLFQTTIPAGAVVFDIGANVGFYTLLASTLVGPSGKVVAFEPVPRNLRFLKRHMRLNRLRNVSVIEAAVAQGQGVTYFARNQSSLAGQISEKGEMRVETVGLDELIAQGRVPVPDFLKIDVEGAEGDVLWGAQKLLAEHHPTIFLATHNDQVHVQCCALLEAAGYELTPLDGKPLRDCDEILAQAKSQAKSSN